MHGTDFSLLWIMQKWKISHEHSLQLIVVDTHERDLCAAALVELVAARLAAEALKQQLPAKVTEGQREEGLSHLLSHQITLKSH